MAETGGKPGRLPLEPPRHTARARSELLPRARCTNPLRGVVVLLAAALVADVRAAEERPCKPFDLVGRHMLGSSDIAECQIIAKKRQKPGTPEKQCVQHIKRLNVQVGHLERVVCAPGYEALERGAGFGRVWCMESDVPAASDLSCVATAVPVTPSGADTTVPGDHSTNTGARADDLSLRYGGSRSALAFFVGCCVVCLLGVAVVFRRQKRAATMNEVAAGAICRSKKKKASRSGVSVEMSEIACQTVPLVDASHVNPMDQRLNQAEARAEDDVHRTLPCAPIPAITSVVGATGETGPTSDGMASLVPWASLEGSIARSDEELPRWPRQHDHGFLSSLPWVDVENGEDLLAESSSESSCSTLSHYGSDEMELSLRMTHTEGEQRWGAMTEARYHDHAQQQQQQQQQQLLESSALTPLQGQFHRMQWHGEVHQQHLASTKWSTDLTSTLATQLDVDRFVGMEAGVASAPRAAESEEGASLPSESRMAEIPTTQLMSRPTVKTVLTCDVEGCNFRGNHAHMVRHQRTHTGERPFMCTYPVRRTSTPP